MVGGILAGLLLSRNDAGFTHNGALAGLVAVCASSDLYHPAGALVVGGLAGAIFVYGYQWVTERLKSDDLMWVWPLHGLCGSWGDFAAGLFGLEVLGGRGGVSFVAQLVGTLSAILYAFVISSLIYGVLKVTVGIRLTEQEEMMGPDLAIHHVESRPEEAL